MQRLVILFLLNCFTFSLTAQQGLSSLIGARGAGMGKTGLTFQDINSAMGNQAGLAHIERIEVLLLGEQRFINSPIPAANAAVAIPSGFGTFGLTLNYFGIASYNEQKIGLAYARKLFDQLSIGVQFDYLNTRMDELGSKGVVTFEVGIQAQLLPDLQFGFHLYNPTTQELLPGEPIATIYSAGIGYTPAQQTFITLEIQKHIDHTASIRGGVEYRAMDKIAIRTGFATAPTLLTFGLGFDVSDQFIIDAATTYHQILGLSPSLGIRGKF